MTGNARIIAFEGPALAGKTTMIEGLEKRMVLSGIQVLRIEDYTYLAGGHENFPSVIASSSNEAEAAADFFLRLEDQRRSKIARWLAARTPEVRSVVFVDRLIFTCMRIRLLVHDQAGYCRYLQAVKAGEVVLPHMTVFVELPESPDEQRRRMACRTRFPYWEVLYDATGYLEFLQEVDESIVPLGLLTTASDKVDEIELLFRSLLA